LAWWDWSSFDPGAFYDRDYYQSSVAAKGYADYASLEPGLTRTAHRRLDVIDRILPHSRRRLLDVGCGTGVFLDAARDRGWLTSGIEPSPYAADQAQRRGHSVRTRAIESAAPDPKEPRCDCVTLWDCLEHVSDPLAALRASADRLEVGGVLALSTGDVVSLCAWLSGKRWHLYNLPEHLFFFSPRSLKLLLQRVDCRAIALRREVNWVSVEYAFQRLFKRAGKANGRPDRLCSRWFVPATLLDVVGIYARKTH
jgi:SAM-dependent methyltransferase